MASTSIYDWLAVAFVFFILLLMFLAIGDIIDRCVQYWRAYKEEE
jgi:hypothetical protein